MVVDGILGQGFFCLFQHHLGQAIGLLMGPDRRLSIATKDIDWPYVSQVNSLHKLFDWLVEYFCIFPMHRLSVQRGKIGDA